jgi:CRP-like cAMP-binding protein
VALFASLPAETLAELGTHLRRHAYKKGTIVFHKDQAGDALYILESGRIRVFLPSESGNEFTVDTLEPGDVLGEMALLDGGPRSASAVTLEDTVTYTLSREDFQTVLAQSPAMASALLALIMARLRNVMHYTETLAFLDVPGRVARVLLDLAHRYGVKDETGTLINLDLTQSELAARVGATRERVNRAIVSFRRQGLIETRGRKFVIRDARRLAERIY